MANVNSSTFKSLAPFHILAYGTLLGTQFFQTFISGPLSYKALERPHFSLLQQRIFPVYFSLQTALPVVLALTYPGVKSPLGPPSSLNGVFAESNRWSVLAPTLTIFATSLVNLVVVGPATTKLMLDRKGQEKRDGKKAYDPAPQSKEIQKLNKAFGRMHGVSSLLNLVGFLATAWYGVSIAGRLQ